MHVISTVAEMQDVARNAHDEGSTMGCVPTMGALHRGHASLIDASTRSHALTVVSVFVNPTQFGPNEDFDKYPRNLDADIDMIRTHGGTHVFAPSVAEMYPEGFSTSIRVGGITDLLEGARRPGHFDGVATVVTKLFEAIRPDEAYFGQKDYQQTLVVKRIVRDLFIPVKISVMPTIREEDGLALSSRNRYLSAEERSMAAALFKALEAAKNHIQACDGDVQPKLVERAMTKVLTSYANMEIDYAVAVDAETLLHEERFERGDVIALLIAVKIGSTRLIDNMIVTV